MMLTNTYRESIEADGIRNRFESPIPCPIPKLGRKPGFENSAYSIILILNTQDHD